MKRIFAIAVVALASATVSRVGRAQQPPTLDDASAQMPNDLDAAVAAAIERLHATANGRSAGLADPRDLLPDGVALAAAGRLHATLVRRGEKSDTAGVTYYIKAISVRADTLIFALEESYRDNGHVWSAGSAVWVARKGNEWVATRVRRRSIT